MPWTILRATQFHEFVVKLLAPQTLLYFPLLPNWQMQPIAASTVASRLVELVAEGRAQGRVPDLGGPEQDALARFAEQWSTIQLGRPKRVVRVTLPGAAWRAFRDGAQLSTLPGVGPTFAEWAASAASPISPR